MGQDGIRNARIERVSLGYEDHGILTAMLMMDYGQYGHQGFGGYGLDRHAGGSGFGRKPSLALGTFVQGVLKTLEVDEWEKLAGKYCRVLIEDGMARAIGHPLKDIWFTPREALQALKED